jgi:hypothetical protein
VNSLLAEIKVNICENVILPKCFTLVVLRYTNEEYNAAKHGDEANNKQTSKSCFDQIRATSPETNFEAPF